jgi:hypothetical protein
MSLKSFSLFLIFTFSVHLAQTHEGADTLFTDTPELNHLSTGTPEQQNVDNNSEKTEKEDVTKITPSEKEPITQAAQLAALKEQLEENKDAVALAVLERYVIDHENQEKKLLNDLENRIKTVEEKHITFGNYLDKQAAVLTNMHIALLSGVAGAVGALIYECGKRLYKEEQKTKNKKRRIRNYKRIV